MKKFVSAVLCTAMILSVMCSPASAFSVSPSSHTLYGTNSLEAIAYMDVEQVSEEMQARIIEARNEIIFSQSWVADGLHGYVVDKDGVIVEEVPQFSELFPSDWEIPFIDDSTEQLSVTAPNTMLSGSQEIMGFYSGDLMLSVPQDGINTPSFCQFNTTGWAGYLNYNITYVFTSALRQYTAMTDTMPTFNVGYTNATTGRSLGWKASIADGLSFGISTPSGITVAVRASMNNPNPNTTSGKWYVTVDGYMDILNELR